MTITRYRKRPVEVDTIQWTGTNIDELIAFTGGDFLLTTEGEFTDRDITAKVYDSLHDTWVGVKTGQHPARTPPEADVTRPSSSPRGERPGRPGANWETELRPTGEQYVPDGTPEPRPNRAARRAARRRKR